MNFIFGALVGLCAFVIFYFAVHVEIALSIVIGVVTAILFLLLLGYRRFP